MRYFAILVAALLAMGCEGFAESVRCAAGQALDEHNQCVDLTSLVDGGVDSGVDGAVDGGPDAG